jgi:general stress protein 26
MSQNEKKHFIELMRDFDDAMLVTHAKDGELRARPMAIADVTDAGDVFFVTGVESGKVDELLQDERTLVTLQGKLKWASVTGRAQFVEDRDKLRELWKKSWDVWFSNGPEDPNVVLIRVHPTEAEYWDMSGKTLATYAFRGLRALLRGEEMKPPQSTGDHAQLQL